MRASAIILIAGIAVSLTVMAFYLWPSSAGAHCPALAMTATEIGAAEHMTRADIIAASASARSRRDCLARAFRGVASWGPPPLSRIVMYVKEPFVADDITRLMALLNETVAATEAANRRLGQIDAASPPV